MVSEIKGPISGIIQSADTRNAQVDTQKTDDANKKTETSTPVASSNVNLTQAASQLHSLEKAVEAAPVVDQQKVDAIRKSILEGTYKVDSEQTASKLIDLDTALPKSS